MRLDDFDYPLPPELIAQAPLAERSASRLLALRGNAPEDLHFRDLPKLLRAGDLLVLNDSRVTHARLLGTRDSGGKVEVLIERVLGEHEVLAQVRASHSPKPGSRLLLEDRIAAEVLDRRGDFYRLRFVDHRPALEVIERHGRLPLPPYIEREPGADDEKRYQTVYAREPGSVAAPTAGLHFDGAILAALRAAGVEIAFITLHVGAGTFLPVRDSDPLRHRMHPERFRVTEETVGALARVRARGGRVVAVGSTALRALEAAAQGGTLRAADTETDLFILPGYRFRVPDCLITNFHLPRSTLFMLVAAFAGLDRIRRAYAHAIERRYRFFSYGDAMFLERAA